MNWVASLEAVAARCRRRCIEHNESEPCAPLDAHSSADDARESTHMICRKGPWITGACGAHRAHLLQISPMCAVVIGSIDARSCDSSKAGTHAIAAQYSGPRASGGLWHIAGGLRVALAHLQVLVITAQRPSRHPAE